MKALWVAVLLALAPVQDPKDEACYQATVKIDDV